MYISLHRGIVWSVECHHYLVLMIYQRVLSHVFRHHPLSQTNPSDPPRKVTVIFDIPTSSALGISMPMRSEDQKKEWVSLGSLSTVQTHARTHAMHMSAAVLLTTGLGGVFNLNEQGPLDTANHLPNAMFVFSRFLAPQYQNVQNIYPGRWVGVERAGDIEAPGDR